jgi:hypothetical protein
MSRVVGQVGAAVRQWGQPAAFRIEPPRWDDEHRARLEQLLGALTQASTAQASTAQADRGIEPSEPAERSVAPGLADEKALAAAATSFWRARERLSADGSDPSAQSRQADRHLETGQDRLAEAGLLIQDHTGTRFDPGLSLEVLAFVDDPALSEPTVVQTVKPCVYLNDRRIQMAQVIVGQPPRTTEIDSPGKGPDHA